MMCFGLGNFCSFVHTETTQFIESLFQAIASESYVHADNGKAPTPTEDGATPTEDVVTPPLPPNVASEESPTSTNRASNRRHTEVGHVIVM